MRYLLILLIFFSGCTTPHMTSHYIIEKSTLQFEQSNNIDIDTVGAILKHLSNTRRKTYITYKQVQDDSKYRLDLLKINPISSNYPVMATDMEIDYVSRFFDQLFKHLEKSGVNINK